MQRLTVKQQKFVDEYVKTGNATQAALDAGYSEKAARYIGSENLTKPYIAQAVKEQMDALHKGKIASQKEVIEFLSRVVRGEELTKRKVYDKDMGWIEITETPSEKGKLTAASELLKRYPDNPELVEAQVAKAKADAENAKAQAELAKEKAAGANLRNNHSESEMSKLSDEDLRAIAELERKETVEDGD